MPKHRQFLLSLVATSLACTSGSDLAVPIIDTLPGGIVHVSNTGPTAWADTNGWKLVLEQTIQPDPGAPGELSNPLYIVADTKGRIFVQDARPTVIKRFSKDGAFLGSFAREGSGPGEISPAAGLLISRDTIVLHDQQQTRTSTWSTEGELISTWPSVCCVFMPTQGDAQGLVPIPGAVIPGDDFLSRLGFVRFRLDGTVEDTVAMPNSGIRGKTWQGPGGGILLVPLQANERVRITYSGLLIGGHQSTYRLFISQTGRDTVRFFDGSATTFSIPDTLRRRTLAGIVEQIPPLEAVARLEDIPTEYPAWSEVTSDGAGNIWVMVPGPSGPSGHWDVFDPDGILLGAVPAPFGADVRSYWTTDRVYTIESDPVTELPLLRVYRIVRNVS